MLTNHSVLKFLCSNFCAQEYYFNIQLPVKNLFLVHFSESVCSSIILCSNICAQQLYFNIKLPVNNLFLFHFSEFVCLYLFYIMVDNSKHPSYLYFSFLNFFIQNICSFLPVQLEFM